MAIILTLLAAACIIVVLLVGALGVATWQMSVAQRKLDAEEAAVQRRIEMLAARNRQRELKRKKAKDAKGEGKIRLVA